MSAIRAAAALLEPPRWHSQVRAACADVSAMNTEVERKRLAGVPVLLVRPVAARGPLPTVLWFHGLAADKEVHLPELHRFAATGLLAVGVDAVGHGERRLAISSSSSRARPRTACRCSSRWSPARSTKCRH
jgi:hypothetical protein